MKSPVLFLTYRRYRTAALVFEAIREAKTPKLYFASNAPNPDNEGEDQLVEQVRNLLKLVDWPCEVYTLFHEKHLSVKYSIPTAIDWFFENEEEGIILEDDCLPHPDFFTFCDNLLTRYAQDERVWVITGDDFQDGIKRGDGSYYFSRYNDVWGWASWRRAWEKADMDIRFWPEWKSSTAWKAFWPDPVARGYWEKIFDHMYRAEIDTWDYPWTASVWYHGGLTATPNVNLVSNIGFGSDATHTVSADSPLAGMATQSLGEIRHPTVVAQDADADRYVFDHAFGGRSRRFPFSWLSFPRRVAGFVFRTLKRRFVAFSWGS